MSNSRPVYSTDRGRLCPDCARAIGDCRCGPRNAPAGDGIVRIARESKGRKGKGVTLVTGIPASEDELKSLAKQLKQLCGTGGTVKAGVIEIQGEHRDRLVDWFQTKGYKVKKAGG